MNPWDGVERVIEAASNDCGDIAEFASYNERGAYARAHTCQTAQPCGEPMINVGNAHQHSCHVNGDHDIDEEENADVHVCECKFAWIIG